MPVSLVTVRMEGPEPSETQCCGGTKKEPCTNLVVCTYVAYPWSGRVIRRPACDNPECKKQAKSMAGLAGSTVY